MHLVAPGSENYSFHLLWMPFSDLHIRGGDHTQKMNSLHTRQQTVNTIFLAYFLGLLLSSSMNQMLSQDDFGNIQDPSQIYLKVRNSHINQIKNKIHKFFMNFPEVGLSYISYSTLLSSSSK